MNLPVNIIEIAVPNTAMMTRPSTSSKLQNVHLIEPDVEEVALILARQRLIHKSRAGSTIAKAKMTMSSTRSMQKRIKKTAIKANKSSPCSFRQRPLPPPPMLPTLRAGQIVLRKN